MKPAHCSSPAVLALVVLFATSCGQEGTNPPAQVTDSDSPVEKIAPVELKGGKAGRQRDGLAGGEDIIPAGPGEEGGAAGEETLSADDKAPSAGASQDSAMVAVPIARKPGVWPDDPANAANDGGAADAPKGWMGRVFGGRRSGLATDSRESIEPSIEPGVAVYDTVLEARTAGEAYWHERVPETLKVRFDANEDGFLRGEELQTFKRFLAVRYDIDGDGRLSAKEMAPLSAMVTDAEDGK